MAEASWLMLPASISATIVPMRILFGPGLFALAAASIFACRLLRSAFDWLSEVMSGSSCVR